MASWQRLKNRGDARPFRAVCDRDGVDGFTDGRGPYADIAYYRRHEKHGTKVFSTEYLLFRIIFVWLKIKEV